MMMGRRLCDCFDLIYGTSTGSIIAALLALGRSVSEVHDLYKKHVPPILSHWTKSGRSAELRKTANVVFEDRTFVGLETDLAVVAARWVEERPMIFKSDVKLTYAGKDSFVPGFGCNIAAAVTASCSAYPFFQRHTVMTSTGHLIELFDGGYCANNPTAYGITDATHGLGLPLDALRVLSVGVGIYPQPKIWHRHRIRYRPLERLPSVKLLQKALEVNTHTAEVQLNLIFGDAKRLRINESFQQPELATDLLEFDLKKLDLLHQHGGDSARKYEQRIKKLLI